MLLLFGLGLVGDGNSHNYFEWVFGLNFYSKRISFDSRNAVLREGRGEVVV